MSTNNNNNIHFLILWVLQFVSVLARNIEYVSLTKLWKEKSVNNSLLFPTYESELYPRFIRIEHLKGGSFIQLKYSDIYELQKSLQNEEKIIQSVCQYNYLNETFYAANWKIDTGWTEVFLNKSLEEIRWKTSEMTKKHVPPLHICATPDGETFSAVFHHSNEETRHFIVEEMPFEEFHAYDNHLMQIGYYLNSLQFYRYTQEPRALGIWRKGFGKSYKIMSSSNFETLTEYSSKHNLRPVTAASLPRNYYKGRARHWIIWHDDDFSWKNKSIPYNGGEKWRKLRKIIEEKMISNTIPSVSIYVSQNDQNFAATFGFADIIKGVEATPDFRYRIASVSKTITAMGIAELVAEGKFSPVQSLFNSQGILRWMCPCHPLLYRLNTLHLLEHTSGFWPHFQRLEFQSLNISQIELLRKAVRKPTGPGWTGQAHLYSNIGFLLLGRIIETVICESPSKNLQKLSISISNQTYGDFIREKLFYPLGINGTISDSVPIGNEVHYYSHHNANPYTSWNTVRMDSAAGWSMTMKDLAILMRHFEAHRKDKYRWLTWPSAARWNYGKGIQMDLDGSFYHVGSLAGSEAIALTNSDTQVAIATNIRDKFENENTGWMLDLCKAIVNGRFHQ